MLTGGRRTNTWDVENRLISVVKDGVTSTYIYDGDGKRVQKTEGGVTTVYPNQFYEKKHQHCRGHHPLLPGQQTDRPAQRDQPELCLA